MLAFILIITNVPTTAVINVLESTYDRESPKSANLTRS